MKSVFVVVLAFAIGLLGGVALCQTEDEPSRIANSEVPITTAAKSVKTPRTPHPSVLNRISRLEHLSLIHI